jgi:hypothetical protein
VLDNVQSESLRKLMAKEGQLISISLGTGMITLIYPFVFHVFLFHIFLTEYNHWKLLHRI